MTTQHTPGPWTRHNGKDFDLPQQLVISDDSQTFVIAAIDRDKRGEANARLIAAAPDLLAALKEAVETIVKEYGFEAEDSEYIAALKAVIAKAQ